MPKQSTPSSFGKRLKRRSFRTEIVSITSTQLTTAAVIVESREKQYCSYDVLRRLELARSQAAVNAARNFSFYFCVPTVRISFVSHPVFVASQSPHLPLVAPCTAEEGRGRERARAGGNGTIPGNVSHRRPWKIFYARVWTPFGTSPVDLVGEPSSRSRTDALHWNCLGLYHPTFK